MPNCLRFKIYSVLFLCFQFAVQCHAGVPVFQHFEEIPDLKNKYVKSIAEDKYGYIWIGTTKGVYTFQNRDVIGSPLNEQIHHAEVQDLHFDSQDKLWIATKNQGLFMYDRINGDNTVVKIDSNGHAVDTIQTILSTEDNALWIGTHQGLFTVSDEMKLVRPQLNSDVISQTKSTTKSQSKLLTQPSAQTVSSLAITQNKQLVVGSIGMFYLMDLSDGTVKSVDLDKEEYVHDLHVDDSNILWIASSDKLRKYNIEENTFTAVPQLPEATRVLSLQQFNNHMWVATIDGGVYQMDMQSNTINQYTYDKNHSFSLLENHIRTIFISKADSLWVGNFSGGLSQLDLNHLHFNFETNTDNSIHCAKNSKITAVMVDKFSQFWLGTEYGLIKYDPVTSTCQIIETSGIESNFSVYSLREDGRSIWLSTSIGLLEYQRDLKNIKNHIQGHIKAVAATKDFSAVFFSLSVATGQLMLGTDRGLFEYSLEDQSYRQYPVNSEYLQNKPTLSFAINRNKQLLLPTSAGLLYLSDSNVIEHYPETLDVLKGKEIIGIHNNHANELIVSVRSGGVYAFDAQHTLKTHYFDDGIFTSANDVLQIQSATDSSVLWLGSKKGLIYLNTETNEQHLFSGTSKSDYLALFRSSINHQNRYFFAGDSGYVSFTTEEIDIENRETPLYLGQLSLANTPISKSKQTQSGFILDSIIEETKNLSFTHRDKLIKLEFNNLNYYNRNGIRFAYKLEPVLSEWVELAPRENSLYFTQLESGNYELIVKTTNRNQVWSDDIKSIAIEMKPAPWFSWWAYLLYTLSGILLVYWYVRNKTKQQIRLNAYLNSQVKKQTLHIENQKKELQNLMERKDEIFSNVSHEFRTPITLIQGPVAALKKNEKNKNKISMLQMVERNSNRLLRLVNQMLELSKSVESNAQQRSAIQLAVRLELIAEPYVYHAQKQGIEFSYDQFHDVTIQTTPDALELTIGNYLSNAFKYAKSDGKVHLGTEIIDNRVRIYVRDNGEGFDEGQKEKIFQRFTRLSQHSETEGVGIGLAIVKEIALLNDAEVSVESKLHNGSTFSISFPIDDFLMAETQPAQADLNETSQTKPNLLIIEDNTDMRLHMKNSLKKDFNCLLEANGKDGVATAIKAVPDIIISDVMMPEMNGFQISRILRNEVVTSHIPLVLLTALTDRPSRIKGWKEGIDLYVDKPFDVEELIFQLKNILKVRKILNKKNQSLIKEDANKDAYPDLLEIDKSFVVKLKNSIKENYKDPSFGLSAMANLMFVSEKQLQRKTKALLNLSPLAVLREYRFEKAAASLRKGYQVSATSDNCGFSSVSYFSQMFKQRYGMTPKQYQNCNKKSDSD